MMPSLVIQSYIATRNNKIVEYNFFVENGDTAGYDSFAENDNSPKYYTETNGALKNEYVKIKE